MTDEPRFLHAKDVEGHVGETFAVVIDLGNDGDTELLSLKLASCEATKVHEYPNRKRDPFSLIFLGPVEPLLPQGTYTLTSDSWGRHDFFLVPVGQTETNTRYQSLFT